MKLNLDAVSVYSDKKEEELSLLYMKQNLVNMKLEVATSIRANYWNPKSSHWEPCLESCRLEVI
jgi:hypothetical protein